MKATWRSFWLKIENKPHWGIGLVVLIALLHALIYVFIVPPWQHYDEPAHFEHVWLRAAGQPVVPNGWDDAFRKELVRSMYQHDFYPEGFTPDFDNLKYPIGGLQYLQLDERPFYYWAAALPVSLLLDRPIETQLYAARLVSVLMFVISIYCAWGLVREIAPSNLSLQLLVPLSMALLPGYVDLMTAVNNDVAAAAVSCFFFWGAARLFTGKSVLPNLAWIAAAAALALFNKSTAFLIVPLAVLPVLFVLFQKINLKIAVPVFLVGIALAGFLVPKIMWREDAAGWYRMTSQSSATRKLMAGSPHGEAVMLLDRRAPTTPRWLAPLYQPVSPQVGDQLKGKVVTVGVWMWAETLDGTEPLVVESPILNVDETRYSRPVRLLDTPRFFSFQAEFPEDFSYIWLTLEPGRNLDAVVFYDGIILAEGAFPGKESPTYSQDAMTGEWGGQPFANLLHNPSMESTWVTFQPRYDSLMSKFLPDNVRPSTLTYLMMEWEFSQSYYQQAIRNINTTFWAAFGWGHVRFSEPIVYQSLGTLILFAAIGSIWEAFRKGWYRRGIAWFLALSLVIGIGMVMSRAMIFLFITPRSFIPAARYLYPFIIPMVLLLVCGIFAGFSLVRMPRKIQYWLYLLPVVLLDIFSIRLILQFYS